MGSKHHKQPARYNSKNVTDGIDFAMHAECSRWMTPTGCHCRSSDKSFPPFPSLFFVLAELAVLLSCSDYDWQRLSINCILHVSHFDMLSVKFQVGRAAIKRQTKNPSLSSHQRPKIYTSKLKMTCSWSMACFHLRSTAINTAGKEVIQNFLMVIINGQLA